MSTTPSIEARLMLYESIAQDLGALGSRAVINRVMQMWKQAEIEKGGA